MQILVPFLILGSVFGFHKGLHKFILGGALLMDYVSCLKHLTLDFGLGCGVFLFGRFKQVYRFLGLFLLLIFGFKFLYSHDFRIALVRFLCDFRAKSRNLKLGFCSKHASEIEKLEELNSPTDIDSDGEFAAENHDDCNNDEDSEFDIPTVMELLKIERRKLKAARAELAKERAASATAAEEAMAMILRLQKEKSLLEMEWSQYRRLAEEKQIHDQEVIRSLQWLVWQHEHERSSLKPQRRQQKKMEEVEDEAQSSFDEVVRKMDDIGWELMPRVTTLMGFSSKRLITLGKITLSVYNGGINKPVKFNKPVGSRSSKLHQPTMQSWVDLGCMI